MPDVKVSDFKKQVVESKLPGSSTQAETSREYKISLVMINQCKKDYKARKEEHCHHI